MKTLYQIILSCLLMSTLMSVCLADELPYSPIYIQNQSPSELDFTIWGMFDIYDIKQDETTGALMIGAQREQSVLELVVRHCDNQYLPCFHLFSYSNACLIKVSQFPKTKDGTPKVELTALDSEIHCRLQGKNQIVISKE